MKYKGIIFFLFSFIGAYLIHIALNLLPPYLTTIPYLNICLKLILVLFAFMVFCLIRFVKSRDTLCYSLIGALSFFCVASITIVYRNTDYGSFGDGGDQGFLTALVTKSAYNGYFTDAFFKNLPSFYPNLLYYFLGKISVLFHIMPYKMLKIAMVFAPLIISYITYALWKKIVRPEIALIICAAILLYQDWPKIAAWISVVIIIPWWLYYIEDISLNKEVNNLKKNKTFFLTGGLLGAVIIQLQYYWLFAAMLASMIHLGMIFYNNKSIAYLWISARDKVIVISLSLALSIYYWLPYIISMLKNGSEPMQNRWYEDWMSDTPLIFTEINYSGIVFLAGLIYVIGLIKKDTVSRYLLLLTFSGYCWICLGFIGVLIKMPNLHFKMHQYFIVYIHAVISLYALGHFLFLSEYNILRRYKMSSCLTVFSVFLIPFCLNFQRLNGADIANDTRYDEMKINIFKELTNNNFYNKVILTDGNGIHVSCYLPIYLFHALMYHTHPAALYNDRMMFQKKISDIHDVDLSGLAIMNNRYDKIDYLYFNTPENEFSVFKDSFPYNPVEYKLKFPDELLQDRYFIKKIKDGYKLYIPIYKNDFLTDSSKNLTNIPVRDLISLYGLLSVFSSDVPSNLKTKYPVQSTGKKIAEKLHRVPREERSSYLTRLDKYFQFSARNNIEAVNKANYALKLAILTLDSLDENQKTLFQVVQTRPNMPFLKNIPDKPSSFLKDSVEKYLGKWLDNSTRVRTYREALNLLWYKDGTWKNNFKERWAAGYADYINGNSPDSDYRLIEKEGFKERNFATFLIPHIKWWANAQ